MVKRDTFMTDRIMPCPREKAEQTRRELEDEQGETMYHYTFPVPRVTAGQYSGCPAEEISADLTQILEQLLRQSQLLVDLLGAVNSLIATQLCKQL